MNYIYAPGCALMAYKPHLAERLKEIIEKKYGKMETILTCCFDKPSLPADTCVITPCATCAEMYAKMEDCTSVCFLNDLAEDADFPFPDYGGMEMSIQDTCSARKQPEVLEAVRKILQRMNITLVEPQFTGRCARCCGQVFYGKMDEAKVEANMKKRADEMPCQDVVVYCSSCIMSMTVGGRHPRFILDLIFGEPTDMEKITPTKWNNCLAAFRADHRHTEK